jgi:hypothetical protein
MISLPRRKFLIAAAGLIAAPAIVRVGSIMPVKVVEADDLFRRFMSGERDHLGGYVFPIAFPPHSQKRADFWHLLEKYRRDMDYSVARLGSFQP